MSLLARIENLFKRSEVAKLQNNEVHAGLLEEEAKAMADVNAQLSSLEARVSALEGVKAALVTASDNAQG